MPSSKSKTKSPIKAQDVPNFAIVACLMSKFEVKHVAGVGLLMRLHYIERAEQFETGEHTTLQFVLDPEQGLEIEAALKRSAQALALGAALKKSLKAIQTPSSVLALAAESESMAQVQ